MAAHSTHKRQTHALSMPSRRSVILGERPPAGGPWSLRRHVLCVWRPHAWDLIIVAHGSLVSLFAFSQSVGRLNRHSKRMEITEVAATIPTALALEATTLLILRAILRAIAFARVLGGCKSHGGDSAVSNSSRQTLVQATFRTHSREQATREARHAVC